MKRIVNISILLILVTLCLTGCFGKDFRIEYGEEGEYGSKVIGGSNIIYEIPAGTYNVALAAGSGANIGFLTIRDSNTTNYNVIEEYKFDFADNNKHEITIEDGQYVHITVDTIFHIYE